MDTPIGPYDVDIDVPLTPPGSGKQEKPFIHIHITPNVHNSKTTQDYYSDLYQNKKNKRTGATNESDYHVLKDLSNPDQRLQGGIQIRRSGGRLKDNNPRRNRSANVNAEPRSVVDIKAIKSIPSKGRQVEETNISSIQAGNQVSADKSEEPSQRHRSNSRFPWREKRRSKSGSDNKSKDESVSLKNNSKHVNGLSASNRLEQHDNFAYDCNENTVPSDTPSAPSKLTRDTMFVFPPFEEQDQQVSDKTKRAKENSKQNFQHSPVSSNVGQKRAPPSGVIMRDRAHVEKIGPSGNFNIGIRRQFPQRSYSTPAYTPDSEPVILSTQNPIQLTSYKPENNYKTSHRDGTLESIPEDSRLQTTQPKVDKTDKLKGHKKKRKARRLSSTTSDGRAITVDPKELSLVRRITRQISGSHKLRYVVQPRQRKPRTFFELATFTCCFCLSPFGLIAMVLAVLSGMAYEDGNRRKGHRLRIGVLLLSILGIVVTLTVVTVLLVTRTFPRITSGGST